MAHLELPTWESLAAGMAWLLYQSRIGFRFSEPDFTITLDLSQSQNPRLNIAEPLVLFNQKIKISGKLMSRDS